MNTSKLGKETNDHKKIENQEISKERKISINNNSNSGRNNYNIDTSKRGPDLKQIFGEDKINDKYQQDKLLLIDNNKEKANIDKKNENNEINELSKNHKNSKNKILSPHVNNKNYEEDSIEDNNISSNFSHSQSCIEKTIIGDLIKNDKFIKNNYNDIKNNSNIGSPEKLKPALTKCFQKNRNRKGFCFVDTEIGVKEKEFITNILSSHFIFKDASSELMNSMLNTVKAVEVKAGFTLFKENDVGNLFYIIKEGEVEIIINKMKKRNKILKEGITFGELALLQKGKRTATAVVSKNSILYILERKAIFKFLNEINKKEVSDRARFVSLICLFCKKYTNI